jgi:tetratricopeptide (TPR) repeat protein
MQAMIFRFTHLRWFFAAAMVCCAAGPAHAKNEGTSDFWQDLAFPGHLTFTREFDTGMKLLKRGEARLYRSYRIRSPLHKRHEVQLAQRILGDALAAFRRAAKATPQNPRAALWIGHTLYKLGRCPAAIKAYGHARRLSTKLLKNTTISFNLGICYSKLGNFQQAVAEYNLLEWVLAPRPRYGRQRETRATAHGNAAEALMALGRLDEAIQRYRRALSYGSDQLFYWGLAVALDRDEQISRSQQALKTALGSNGKGMRRLSDSGVFFIPAGDIHYYRGLGYLGLREHAKAKAEFEAFMRKLPKSQWSARVRAHLAALGKAPVTRKRGRKLAPQPTVAAYARDTVKLDRKMIRNRVRNQSYYIGRCYRRALRRSSKLAGTMKVRITVKARGRSAAVRIASTTMRDKRFLECVINRVKGIYFSSLSSKKPVTATVPLQFKVR